MSPHSSIGEALIVLPAPAGSESPPEPAERLLDALPIACVCASAVAIAWHHDGSILAPAWLPYATLIALVLAAELSSSDARFSRPLLTSAALVGSYGIWMVISASWSPVPALARDEFLLIALYGFVLVSQGRGFRSQTGRFAALALVVGALGISAVAVAIDVRFAAHPEAFYSDGRLVAPISYVNASAAFFLVGLWPALMLAARRGQHALLRGLALAAAAAMLAGWLGTQSKGATAALAVSAVAIFAVVPGRLRLFVPTALVTALVFSQYYRLTGPFRAEGDPDVARRAATAALLVTAVGVVIGIAYALADARLVIHPRVRRAAAIGLASAGVLGLAVGGWQADRHIDDRSTFVRDQWENFKRDPGPESGSSHLVNLGSNRYDFWRVSLIGFEDHPVAGIGGRGFGSLYLQERQTGQTPARAHSLPLDALLETGLVGFALLVASFAAILVGVFRARRTVAGAAAFGAVVYFVVHASADWVWTFPAVGLPVFALVGLALAPGAGEGKPIGGRMAIGGAAAVMVFAVAAFVPPWLSARITDAALAGDVRVESLDWAERLDPLTVEPLLARAALARTPEGRLGPLRDAVEKEPRSVGLRVGLAEAYLAAGRNREAAEQLAVAQRLFPGDEGIEGALRRARRG